MIQNTPKLLFKKQNQNFFSGEGVVPHPPPGDRWSLDAAAADF